MGRQWSSGTSPAGLGPELGQPRVPAIERKPTGALRRLGSAGQGPDLGQVAGEYGCAHRIALRACRPAGAVPAVAAFELADPPFAARTPFHAGEAVAVLDRPAGRLRSWPGAG